MRTQKAFLEDIKVLLEENGAGHLFKALKEMFYKYIERIMEKQQTGGGLSAGVQEGQGNGGPAYNVGQQVKAARTWMLGQGHQYVDVRTWMPGRGHRTWMPGCGRQDLETRK